MDTARKLSMSSVAGWIRQPGLIFVVLSLLLFFPIVAVILLSPRQAPDVTLVTIEGEVTIANVARGEERIIPAGEATTVEIGEEIHVAEDSMATLTFFDGATSDLFAGTTLKLEQFQAENDHYQVGLDLTIGKITTQIQRLLRAGESFEVITPSSAVTVRGTVFTVEVFPDQSTEVSCDEGIVAVTTDDQQIELLYPGDSILVGASSVVPTQEVVESPSLVEPITATPTSTETPSAPQTENLPTATSQPTEAVPVTNLQPTPVLATAVPSSVEVTSQIESVWYCTALDASTYEWYEVELIFHDGVKVEEHTLSGPYTGGWQPNCPAGDAAPADNTSTSGGDSGGSDSSGGSSGGGGGSDCLVNPDC